MMDTKGNIVAGFNFICFAILIPPFIWHCRNKNIPASTLIFWLMVSDLTSFIGAIIWSGPDFYMGYDGKGYCDVVIKVKSGLITGALSASAALSLQLFLILKGAAPAWIDNKSWRKKTMDLSICLATPVFIIATSYVVQYQRIGVTRYRGCEGIYAKTWVTNVLISMWPLIWSTFAMIFSFLTILTYFKKQKEAKDLLKCTNSGLNVKRFAKLLTFSVVVLLSCLPLSLYNFIVYEKSFRGAYNWDMIHHPLWNETVFFDSDPKSFYDIWVIVGLSVAVFVLFGLGSDAVSMYKTFLINIGVGRIFHIEDPRETGGLFVSEQVKTATNQTGKSEFTMNSAYTDATITDGIDVEFNKVIGDCSTNTSPGASDARTARSYPMDLEKASHDVLQYTIDDDSREELEYIMNMAKDDAQEINFDYSISHKP